MRSMLVPCLVVTLAACTVKNESSDAGTSPKDGDLVDSSAPTDGVVAADTGAGEGGTDDASLPTDSSADTATDTRTLTLDDACSAWAANECAVMTSCTPYALKKDYGDAKTCSARMKLLCMARGAAPGLAASYAESIKACAGVTPSCSKYRNGIRDASCNPPGTLAAGKPCGIDAQCAAGLACNAALNGSTCGTCVKALKPGEACNGPDPAVCTGGSYCAKGIQCVIPYGLGEDCSAGIVGCDASTWCDGSKCVARGAANDACNPNESSCDEAVNGSSCDDTARKCVVPATANPGDACSTLATVCLGSSSCLNNGSGVCQGPTKDGDSCSAATPPCMPPAACDDTSKTCVVPDYTTCK